jgi:hypothetical protein
MSLGKQMVTELEVAQTVMSDVAADTLGTESEDEEVLLDN